MHDELDPLQDPLGLEAIDEAIHRNERDASPKPHTPWDENEFSLDSSSMEDEPFPHDPGIAAFEGGVLGCCFEQLLEAGVELPPPESLDDARLHAKLWEVVNALASMDTFISRTDHLSDRELYEHLWHDALREVTTITRPGSGWVHCIDMLGACSEEDIQNSLRYYDTEEERQRWAKDFPNDEIPPHVDPPYDRDRHLPNEPGPIDEQDDNV